MLDKIIYFSIKNKFVVAVMTMLLIVWGIWSASKLPIDAVPDITNNQVQIITLCPTLAGQEVEQLVTFPIEQSIANLPDIIESRSISRFGLSVITVVFDEDVDIYFARQLINERLKEAEEKIPNGIGKPELAPVSTGLGEIYQYVLHPKKGSEQKYSTMDLRTMQDWIVARQLNGTKGVAEVNSFGGKLKQYEVSINPFRLQAMGITIPDVFNALEKNNQNTGGAYIDKKPNAYFIRGIGLVTSLEDVENIVVKSNANSVPVFIKDVAKVQFGNAIRYGALTYNGEVDAVGGVVMMLKGENSNEVVQRIKEKMIVIQKALPADVIIEAYLDRTDLIKRTIATVEKNLIEGALIVIFVLVLFLGNFRAGLIVASAIPLSMLFALSLMKLFGISANLMSLGAIDFGLIVDGAVIIVEATLHHLGLRQSMRKLTAAEMDEEVYVSASKIRSSAAFGEIIIMMVYIPILSLVGIEGKMFKPMAITVGFAILGALILSLTYIPMMCALFLPKQAMPQHTFSDKMMAFFHKLYLPLLQKAIRFKYLLIGCTTTLFFISLFLFSRMGGEFIPTLQEGDFAFHCMLPQGTSLSQSLETSMQASRIIKQFDEVKMVIGKTGTAEVPTDPMPPEVTDMIIILKPQSEWKQEKSYDELADEIYEKLDAIPGVFFEKSQPIQMRFNELMTGIRQDVAVKVFGENMDTLLAYANKVGSVIQTVEGTTAPMVERVEGLPQINIEYDRMRLANYGLSVEEVNDIVSTAFAGKSTGVVYENERKFDLVVRLDSTFRNSIEDVSSLFIPTSQGNQIPLSQVANISYKLGAAQISREDGKRRVVVGFNVDGRDVQSVVKEIQEKLYNKFHLPTGYYLTFGGTFENLQQATNRLLIAVPASLFLVFVLLFFTFNSIKQALLIFTAIPMSAIGGVFALLIRDMPFSISAGIGFIALFGVAVLNGIVLISTFNQLEKSGDNDVIHRILEGTKIRLRPVLMTATVASLGFLPMALSNSSGAEVQKPLATVVIGGLISATFLTLFVLPLLYIIVNGKFSKINSNMKTVVSSLVLMLLSAHISHAQTKVMTVDEITAMAIQNSYKLKAEDLNIQSANSLIRSANEMPKLNVNVQFGQYSSIKFDNAFSITQTIPFPTLFAAKRNAIKAAVSSKELDKQIAKNEIVLKVQSYFYQLLYLENYNQKLQYLDSLYQDFVATSSLRYKSGETKQLEKTTAEAKRNEIMLQLSQNEFEIAICYKTLKLYMDNNDSFAIHREALYTPIIVSALANTVQMEQHPTIQKLQQEAIVAEQNRKLEKANGLPDFTLSYANQSLIGFQNINNQDVFFNAAKRFHYGAVGIDVPLTYGATKSKMKSLEIQKQALQATAQFERRELEVQLLNAQQQYFQYLSQYRFYIDNALPSAQEIIKAAKLGYTSGEVNYIEFLLALENKTEVELKCMQTIQQINQIALNINYLTSK